METKALQFEVIIDPTLPPTGERVSFETGASPEQVEDPRTWAYDHHGLGFKNRGRGALTAFFEDLILGAPFPFVFGTHRVRGVDTVVAIALFSHRELAVAPATPSFVAATDLYHRQGDTILGHLPADVGRFLRLLGNYFPPGLGKEDVAERLSTAVQWVREYLLEDRLPHVGGQVPDVRVIDIGSNGFLVAECDRPSREAWVEVYRMGFLRGVLFGPDHEGKRVVSISRKSSFLEFDLTKAARLLDELEVISGEEPGWRVEGFYLTSPEGGTVLLPSMVLDVLVRC